MLTGPDFAAALRAAMTAKQMKPATLAQIFNVKPPSVQGWMTTGRIHRDKLQRLIALFADTVPPTHWGLEPSSPFGGHIPADQLAATPLQRKLATHFAAALPSMSDDQCTTALAVLQSLHPRPGIPPKQ